jgi:hypothetical protein
MIAECCKIPENLVLQPTDRAELQIRICKECGRRHFELTVEPGEIGIFDPMIAKAANDRDRV